MRIDSHVHHWSLRRGDYGWLRPDMHSIYRDFGAADFDPLRRAAHIDRVILVQAAATIEETAYLMTLARRSAYVMGVVGWLDFDDPDAAQLTHAAARDLRLLGLRPMIQDIDDDRWMLSGVLDPMLQSMAAHGLVFDALVRERHLPHLYTLALRHSDVSFVIDHAAKPNMTPLGFAGWQAPIARCASLPNVHCKLSGLLTELAPAQNAEDLERFVRHLVDTFGAERLLWGSDWPVLNLASDYQTWHDLSRTLLASLSSEAQDGIFGDNALALYERAA